jgi:hypothetical protein
MSFGFPAYHKESRRFKLPRAELLRAAKRALQALGWTFSTRGVADLVVNTSVSWWSWGETLTVDVGDDGRVRVQSKCALPTQCFDWGKNRKNVTRFLDELRQQIDEEEPGGRKPRPADDRTRPAE